VERVVALLCNPSAGGGRAARVLPEVEAALRELNVSFHTELTRDVAHARELARAAARAGEATVTLGGDGLVGCVVGGLRDVPNGSAFIGIASRGFDSDANRIANTAPSRLGKLVYLYGGLRALAAWKPARFELRLDGEPLAFSGYSVAAANSSSYGGGMKLAPDAALDDGLLDIVLIAAHSKPGFLRTLPQVFKGAHVTHPAVRIERVRALHVDADRPFEIYADGDPVGRTPATIGITPGAVSVLAPR